MEPAAGAAQNRHGFWPIVSRAEISRWVSAVRCRCPTRGAAIQRPGGQAILVARPPMPRDLPAEAKAEWQRIVPQLEDMGDAATIDRGVLIRYCTAWADWLELDRLLQRSTKLIKGQKGNLVRNPLWLMRRDAEQMLAELCRQLGLTPAARLRAGVRHERPPDPEEESRSALQHRGVEEETLGTMTTTTAAMRSSTSTSRRCARPGEPAADLRRRAGGADAQPARVRLRAAGARARARTTSSSAATSGCSPRAGSA